MSLSNLVVVPTFQPLIGSIQLRRPLETDVESGLVRSRMTTTKMIEFIMQIQLIIFNKTRECCFCSIFFPSKKTIGHKHNKKKLHDKKGKKRK